MINAIYKFRFLVSHGSDYSNGWVITNHVIDACDDDDDDGDDDDGDGGGDDGDCDDDDVDGDCDDNNHEYDKTSTSRCFHNKWRIPKNGKPISL